MTVFYSALWIYFPDCVITNVSTKCIEIYIIFWNQSIFYGHFLDEPYRMMECWNIGHEKRKTDYPTRNVEATFFDDALQTSIFCFFPPKNSIKTRKSMKSYALWILDSLNPSFQGSNIPLFRLWAKRINLFCGIFTCPLLTGI